MPLTECPDCGGILSDAALTCPTCHRVMRSIQPESVKLPARWGPWLAVALVAALAIWGLLTLL